MNRSKLFEEMKSWLKAEQLAKLTPRNHCLGANSHKPAAGRLELN